jgi:hypothetical protein
MLGAQTMERRAEALQVEHREQAEHSTLAGPMAAPQTRAERTAEWVGPAESTPEVAQAEPEPVAARKLVVGAPAGPA